MVDLDLDRGLITVAWAFEHGCPSDAPCGKARGGNCPKRETRIPAGMEVPMPPARTGSCSATSTAADRSRQRALCSRDQSQNSRGWKAILAPSGLPDVKLHSARHTTATLLYKLGVPGTTRMAILAHSSVTVTTGYTHVADALAHDAMGRLGILLDTRELMR